MAPKLTSSTVAVMVRAFHDRRIAVLLTCDRVDGNASVIHGDHPLGAAAGSIRFVLLAGNRPVDVVRALVVLEQFPLLPGLRNFGGSDQRSVDQLDSNPLRWRPSPRDVLAFEAGCEGNCDREVDELELQGGRVYLHLGARRDDPPRG